MSDLRTIASRHAGRQLLEDIDDATPRVTRPAANSDEQVRQIPFGTGINVVIRPLQDSLLAAGRPYRYRQAGEGRPFYPEGQGCFTMALDDAASRDGGSVAIVHFTNAQMLIGRTGEYAPSYVVLAHELIHALHYVTGTRSEGSEEESSTRGVNARRDFWAVTENEIRREHGLPERT